MAKDMQPEWDKEHEAEEIKDVTFDAGSKRSNSPISNYRTDLGHGNRCIHCNKGVVNTIEYEESKPKEETRIDHFKTGRYEQMTFPGMEE